MGSGSSSKSKKADLQDDGKSQYHVQASGALANAAVDRPVSPNRQLSHTSADRPVSPNRLLRPAGDAQRKCSKNSAMGHQASDGSRTTPHSLQVAHQASDGSRTPSKVRICKHPDTVEFEIEDDSMVRKGSKNVRHATPHGIHPPGIGLHATASSPHSRAPSKLSPYVTSDHTGPSGDHHGQHGHHAHHDHGHGHHRQTSSGDAERPPARIVVIDKDLENLVMDIENLFPVDEYEMTLYAAFPRMRPGEGITLQDFKEKKTLNDVKGKCVDHDGRLHVWAILLEDGKKVRVVPKVLQKALQNPDIDKGGKPVEGFVAYGNDCMPVVLDMEHVSVHRQVKPHIVRPKTPPKEEQVGHDHSEQRHKAKKKAKKKKTLDEEAPQEEEKEVVRPFEVGDMVVMKDAGGARLGVGKVKELGEMREDHRMLKVEFGQRGGVYNLEDTEIMLTTQKKIHEH